MADMIKFFKGLEASLPASGVNGALYITTDEGGIYLGTGTGMQRLGDFVQVANVASLPAKAHEKCLYYCVAENILAKWNGTEWKQINKQPTAEELKTLLGLGSLAYKSEVVESDLNTDLAKKINDSYAANHSHANKDLLDTYTQTEADLADAVAKKHEHANADELAKFVDGDKEKYDAVVADHLTAADKEALEGDIADAKSKADTAEQNAKDYADETFVVKSDYVTEYQNLEGLIMEANIAIESKADKSDLDAYALAEDVNGQIAEINIALDNKADQTDLDSAVERIAANETAIADKADKSYVGTLPETATATDIVGYIQEKTSGIATEGAMTELAARVDAVEDVAEANAAAIGDISTIGIDTGESTIYPENIAEAIQALEDNKINYPMFQEYVATTATTVYVDETFATKSDVEGEVERIDGEIGGLQEQITANANAITALTDGIDPDKIDGLTDLVNWANEHAPEVESIKNDIEANAKAIADQATSDAATYETKADATSKKAEIDGRLDALEGKVDVEKVSTAIADAVKVETDRATGVENGLAGRIKDLEDNKAGYATTGQVATAKQEAMDYADETFVVKSDYVTEYQNLEGLIMEANIAIESKADKSDLDAYALAEDVNGQIAEINIALDNKADQTDLDSAVERIAANETAIGTLNTTVDTKANSADVYAKTETFTKDEVNAAIAAAVEAAHTWGSF